MENLDYEHDIEIDQDALDLEWLEQPMLMLKYAKNLAFWKRRVEKAKTQLELVKAQLDREIRENPESFEINTKLTETVIFNTILKQPNYIEANLDVINSKYEQNVAQAAVDAMDHRKSALENLVRLFGQQYFAGPSIPNNINREWEKKAKEKRVNEVIASRMMQRKK